MQFLAAILLLVVFNAASAQQLDPDFLQKAISAVQAQRNAALDKAAVMEAQATKLAEENAKLKAEIDELKKKKDP